MKQCSLLLMIIATFYILSCRKEYSFERAVGTLKDNSGVCLPITISGTYEMGKPLIADSFFVIVEVNVTQSGPYVIETDINNGFMFSASGEFTSTGIQKVKLRPEGTALNNLSTIFTCTFNNSACTFSINVSSASINLPPEPELNTWRFFDSTNGSFHYGIFEPLQTLFDVQPQWNNLILWGWPGTFNSFSRDTVFLITLFFRDPIIETGTYNITSGIGGNNVFAYANNKKDPTIGFNQYFSYYSSTIDIVTNFTFKITSYDSLKKTIKGTFEGASRKQNNISDFVRKIHTVSGAFYCKLN